MPVIIEQFLCLWLESVVPAWRVTEKEEQCRLTFALWQLDYQVIGVTLLRSTASHRSSLAKTDPQTRFSMCMSKAAPSCWNLARGLCVALGGKKKNGDRETEGKERKKIG